MVQTADTIFRDFETDGVPASGTHKPKKSEIRPWGTRLENLYSAAQAGGGLAYETKADMTADLAHGANQIAWVMEDPTAANNGIYAKVGASGSGSWNRLGDLPYSYIKASNAGAGTANAIVATTSIPIPAADGGALIALPIVADNDASPVMVSFNGGAALTIKTNSGNDVSIGGLTAGMIPAGYVSGTTFRLLSDQAGAATAAAAEAAADRAEAAAASVNYLAVADRAALKAVDTGVHSTIGFDGSQWMRVNYADFSALIDADTQGGVFARSTTDPTKAWMRLYSGPKSTLWFGATGDDVDTVTALQAAVTSVDAGQGGTLLLPAPTTRYRVASAGLTISGDYPVTIQGDGQPEIRTAAAGDAILIGGGTTNHQGYVNLRDFKLWGETGSVRGIKAVHAVNLNLSRLSLYQIGGLGAWLDNCYTFGIDESQLNACGDAGFYATGASMNGSVISRSKFLNHSADGQAGIAIEAGAGGSGHFGGLIEACDIEINDIGIKLADIDGLTIDATYFEANRLHVYAAALSSVRNLSILRSLFLSTGLVELNDVDGLTLGDLIFYDTGTVLDLTGCSDIRASGIKCPNGGTIRIDGVDYTADEINGVSWKSYTPAWSAATAPSLGNGVVDASYIKKGKTVSLRIGLTVGSTTTFGTGGWTFSLPIAARNVTNAKWIGNGEYRDASVPSAAYTVLPVIAANGTTLTVSNSDGTAVTSTSPFTWASGDQLWLQVEYEAA